MLHDSPVSKNYFLYMNVKYGQKVAPLGLLTLCSIVSARIIRPKFPIGFNLCKVAPSGHFKSRTSIEAQKAMPKEYSISLKSDFTLHSIRNEYQGDVRNKCLLINDGTLLLGSKSRKAKERVINGIAEVLSDGTYHYADFRQYWDIVGPCTCVFNITSDAFERYEKRLLASTFINRFLTVHYNMPLSEMRDFIENRERRKAIRFDDKLTVNSEDVSLGKFEEVIIDYGEVWSALSGIPLNRMTDEVDALVKAHAALNHRDEVNRDDVWLLRTTEQYVSNPSRGNAAKIRALHQQGRSIKDICLLLGKNPASYRTTVSRILSRARKMGVFD